GGAILMGACSRIVRGTTSTRQGAWRRSSSLRRFARWRRRWTRAVSRRRRKPCSRGSWLRARERLRLRVKACGEVVEEGRIVARQRSGEFGHALSPFVGILAVAAMLAPHEEERLSCTLAIAARELQPRFMSRQFVVVRSHLHGLIQRQDREIVALDTME